MMSIVAIASPAPFTYQIPYTKTQYQLRYSCWVGDTNMMKNMQQLSIRMGQCGLSGQPGSSPTWCLNWWDSLNGGFSLYLLGISPTHFASFPYQFASFPHQICFVSPKKCFISPTVCCISPTKCFISPTAWCISLCNVVSLCQYTKTRLYQIFSFFSIFLALNFVQH